MYKQPRSYHGFSRGNELLFEIAGFFENGIRGWCRRRDVLEHLSNQKRPGKQIPKQRYYVYLERARKRGLLESRKKGDDFLLRFSDEGKRHLLISEIKAIRACYSGKEICIVAFDFPESERLARRVFRNFIRQCGFRQFQKSVWTCDRQVARLLMKFVNEMKLTSWVSIFEGKNVR